MTGDRIQIDFACGLFSRFPDTPWFGGMVGSGRYGELRAVGLLDLSCAKGRLYLISIIEADIEVYACKRPIDAAKKLPTWNMYSPAEEFEWQQGGAKGGDDAELIFRGTVGMKHSLPIELDEVPQAIIIAPGKTFDGLIDIHGYVEILK